MFGWKYTSCHFHQTFQPCSWIIHTHTHTPRNSKFKAKQVWLLHKYQWNHHVRGLQLQNSCTIFSVFRPACTDLGVPFKTIHAFQLCVWNSASENRWKWNVYFKHTSVCMQELSPLSFLLFITFIHFPFFCFFFSNLFLCVIIPRSESQGRHSIHFL